MGRPAFVEWWQKRTFFSLLSFVRVFRHKSADPGLPFPEIVLGQIGFERQRLLELRASKWLRKWIIFLYCDRKLLIQTIWYSPQFQNQNLSSNDEITATLKNVEILRDSGTFGGRRLRGQLAGLVSRRGLCNVFEAVTSNSSPIRVRNDPSNPSKRDAKTNSNEVAR